jgi:hypothetical protein
METYALGLGSDAGSGSLGEFIGEFRYGPSTLEEAFSELLRLNSRTRHDFGEPLFDAREINACTEYKGYFIFSRGEAHDKGYNPSSVYMFIYYVRKGGLRAYAYTPRS